MQQLTTLQLRSKFSFSDSHKIKFSNLLLMVSSCPCTTVMHGQQLSK